MLLSVVVSILNIKPALDKLRLSLSTLQDPAPNIIFCGDFNLPHASWTDDSTSAPGNLFECLTEFTNDHFLSQHVTTPTHVNGGVLDLIFSNNKHIIHSYSTLTPLRSTSDHYVVEVNTPLLCVDQGNKEEKPPFASPFDCLNFHSNDIDWDAISTEIKTLTDNPDLAVPDPNMRLQQLMDILVEVCYKHVPARKSSRKNSTQIPRHRRILMRKRRKFSLKLERSTSDSRKVQLKQKLIQIEMLLQTSHVQARTRKEQLAVKAIKTNPRFFFSYAKQYSATKSSVGPLLNEKNEYENSSYEMANILSKQYSSVFSIPSTKDLPEVDDTVVPTIDDVIFTEEDIISAIDELRNNSASGPNGISAIY